MAMIAALMAALVLMPATHALLGSTRSLGAYILIADDTSSYNSTYDWQPALYAYQQQGFNVFFLTFINPVLMPAVPPAYARLAQTRGSSANGAVPKNAIIMFSIGGESYSDGPWPFLASPDAAVAMAAEVSKWPERYGCDGIDIDIETGAGTSDAGANLVLFIAKLKELNPAMLISQPVFGSPSSVPAANLVIEAGFNSSFPISVPQYSYGSVAAVGIMVYQSTGALMYVSNYVEGCSPAKCSEYYCPLAACVNSNAMLLGAGGGTSAADILTLANAAVSQNLAGIMVWFASVLDSATNAPALFYSGGYDASEADHTDTQPTWAQALSILL